MKSDRKVSILNGLVFLILGVILFVNPGAVIKFISYFLGGLLIGLGIYKTINYYIHDKKNGVVNTNELAFGITAIILGVVFIFLADAIELVLRFIIGGWLLVAGISKISQTFFTTSRDSKFYGLIVIGVILISIGLYIILVSNLALSIIGLFMMLYGLIDIVSFFVYKDALVVKKNNKYKDGIEEAEIVSIDEDE